MIASTNPDDQSPTAQPSHAHFVNNATVLLLRWWGLFEAPKGTELSPLFEDLFDDAIEIDFLETHIQGADAVKAGIAALPRSEHRSHELIGVALEQTGPDQFALLADYTYQIEPEEGSVRNATGTYHIQMLRRADGELVMSKITGQVEPPGAIAPFAPSYEKNRALATVIRFQAILDSLSRDPSPLKELILPDAAFAGLLTPPTDADGALDSWDAVVRGYDGLAAWFGQGPDLFKSVSHALERYTFRALGEARYKAVVQFAWHAETVTGKRLERHTPRSWILQDRGERFMRIEQLE